MYIFLKDRLLENCRFLVIKVKQWKQVAIMDKLCAQF